MTEKLKSLIQEYNHNVIIGSFFAVFTLFFVILAWGWYYPEYAGYGAVFGGLICFCAMFVKIYECCRINDEIKGIECYCGMGGSDCDGKHGKNKAG